MTIACGGRCGNPSCTFQGKNELSINGHVGAIKYQRSQARPSTGPMKGAGPPPPGGPEARPFYAPLRDLPPGFGKPEEKKSAAAAPPPPGPLFDSTPWWLAFGELLDTTLLENKRIKIKMTEERAKRLDASLQAAGWSVTPNPHPVALPFWLPIAVTVFGAFILPLLIAYVPEAIKKARDRAKEAQEKRKPAPVPAQVPDIRGPAYRVEVPKEPPAIVEEEEQETRMTAPPPPFNWKPMPWREPGSP